ncbi:glycosyltransferase 87 family protein [Streptomyces sp. Ag109_O5-10]|uniref:glycosyltransferase 87 family protein n=1 Tax=Streptomyces sp. Ag109_O5-10 TaxID=1855349 RepID=UPI0008985ADE|nr:alpha-1,2-mannosyltransferase [Streptomyces sp. Ag109_O5-10]
MPNRTVTSPSAPPASLPLLLSLSLLTVSLCSIAALCILLRAPMADLLVYRAEGEAVVHGGDLYGFTVTEWRLPATYPPFAAVLFVPATWIPVPALKALFLAGNALLLAWLVALSARLAGRPAPLPPLCAATAFALWLEPVFQTLLFGQVNLAITGLVLWDLTRPPGARAKGLALGIAAGVKLTPALFIAYLFLTARRKEAATATASFAGTALLGALLLPAATVDFWTRRLFETGRVGKAWIVDNQSLQGLAARATGTAAPGLAWMLPAALVAATGLFLAARAHRAHGCDRWGILLTACTALLVCPISWSHHWVWCVPLLAVLLAEGRTLLAATAALLFTARTMWLVPHQGDLDLHLPWWQQACAAPYPLLGLALLAGAGLALRRRSRRLPDRRPGGALPDGSQLSASSSSASMIR